MKDNLSCLMSFLLPIKCFEHLSKKRRKKLKNLNLTIYSSAFKTHEREKNKQ